MIIIVSIIEGRPIVRSSFTFEVIIHQSMAVIRCNKYQLQGNRQTILLALQMMSANKSRVRS